MGKKVERSPKPSEQPALEPMYVVNVRTALSGPNDGLVTKITPEYRNKTVGDVIEYMTDRKRLSQSELTAARSIQSEMARDYTISANGQTVSRSEKVAGLFKPATHKGVEYQSLDIEIASTQEGGLIYYL